MFKPVGYCVIRKNSTTGISTAPISDFEGKPIRVMEFGVDDCVLVINNEGTVLATFNKEDVAASFKCSIHGEYILPPGIEDHNLIAVFTHTEKLANRKGGYNNIIRNMIIATSLHKGEYTVNWLFENQPTEDNPIATNYPTKKSNSKYHK